MRFYRMMILVIFTFQLSTLAQTTYYGGIDLGSKGVKASLFPIPFNKQLYYKTINTTLVSSMNAGEFTNEGIKDATDAVKVLMSEMQSVAKKKNLKVNYFVVGSSGVAKGKNTDAIMASVKAATGIDVDFIDAKKEAYFGIRTAIPRSMLDNAVYIDIGSGNTKLGCLVGGTDLRSFRGAEIRYGSVSLRNKAKEINPSDIKAGIQQALRDDVVPTYEKESMNVPCLRNRGRIYWTGGASWATATFMHPEKALSSRVVITKRDIDTFLSRLSDGSWNQTHFQFSLPKTMRQETQSEIRAAVAKDRKKVMDIFVYEDLLSGVSIMRAILGISNPSAVVTFVRDGGDFLYGYAMERYLSIGKSAAAVSTGSVVYISVKEPTVNAPAVQPQITAPELAPGVIRLESLNH